MTLTKDSNGLRAQLQQLLPPRQALFHVRVHIHQLHNVPLIRGQFAVTWKFHNVHPIPPDLLLPRPTPAPPDDPADSTDDDDAAAWSTSTHHTTRLNNSRPPASNTSLSSSHSSSSHSLPHPSFPQSPVPADFTRLPRGRTPYVPLRDHNVRWDHTVDLGVQIPVHRDSLDLLPSQLKLVVVQRVIPGDPDAPHNPRLGALYLNLAEYAAIGPVERRYLMRESKTNATLQMTIHLRHVGGEKVFHAPPLQKGEVMARVTGLLQRDTLLGLAALHPRAGSTAHATRSGGSADALIDALFNPVPSSSPAPSPFTYYVPPRPAPTVDTHTHTHTHTPHSPALVPPSPPPRTPRSLSGHSTADSHRSADGSVDAHSAHSHASPRQRPGSSSSGGGGRPQKWWRKLAPTRPSSPTALPPPPPPRSHSPHRKDRAMFLSAAPPPPARPPARLSVDADRSGRARY